MYEVCEIRSCDLYDTNERKNKSYACRRSSFQIGKEVQMKGMSIALFRLSNGDIRAVENRCPHKNGPLAEGIVSGEFVFCPLHDWKISLLTGEVQNLMTVVFKRTK